MDSFYLIVLGIATLVLIVLLAFLGWNMSNTKNATKFPTITTTCPDNWISTKKTVDGKDVIVCQRPASGNYNYGNTNFDSDAYMTTTTSVGYVDTSGKFLNFADNKWNLDPKVPNPTCAKKAWAEKYGIKWDSVDNANYC